MREFTETCRHHPSVARELLDHLILHGLVSERRHRGFGSAGYHEIRLTPEGERVLVLLDEIHDIVKEASIVHAQEPG